MSLYFSPLQVDLALTRLELAHPALLSLLAMLRSGAQLSDNDEKAIPFGSPREKDLLDLYFSPELGPANRPYFVPLGPNRGVTRWRETSYPARTLQRLRSDRSDSFFQHAQDNRKWRISPDLVEKAVADESVLGKAPISIADLAVWCYRNKPFENIEDAISAFDKEFKLSERGLTGPLFSSSVPDALASLPMQSEPIKPEDLKSILDKHNVESPASATTGEEASGAISTHDGNWSTFKTEQASGSLRGVAEPVTRAKAALAAGMHVIFTGPPGTGKTSLAKQICEAAGFSAWVVPATDQWSTFETIGGYFPVPGSAEQLDFLPGAVVESIESGTCLIVDEINRADIDKAFGELLTLLSGSSVTLPYRRRSTSGDFRRISLAVRDGEVSDEMDVIPVPKWWRLIGSMNDVDKASLKRLSMAFVRRFAFVPVGLPAPSVYAEIINSAIDSHDWPEDVRSEKLPKLREKIVALFASAAGFAKIGFPLGPAFPLSMISHAASEWTIESSRSVEQVLTSSLELYVLPQLQGRPDIHQDLLGQLLPMLAGEGQLFEVQLAIWTGYLSA